MLKRVYRGLRRRLKGQSVSDANKEWLLQHGLRIGKKVDCFSWEGIDSNYPGLITIGDEVTIAGGVRILTHDASVGYLTKSARIGIVEIGSHVFIGADSTILPNVRIGDWAIVAAGSIVTRDVPPHTVVGGNPARKITTIEEFKEKHEQGLHTHYVSQKPWRDWPNATPEEWAELREHCKDTWAYVSQRKDL